MKDRETAFRTSEHPSQRMAVWVSPVPLPLPLYNPSPFLLDAPACSVGDSKCNSLGLVSSDLQPGTKKERKEKNWAVIVKRTRICLQQLSFRVCFM